MVVVIAEPLAQYAIAASPNTEPANSNDNGAGSNWTSSNIYVAANGRFGGRVVGSSVAGNYTIRLPSGHSENTLILAGWFKYTPTSGSSTAVTPLIASRVAALNSYHWSINITQAGTLSLTGPGSTVTGSPLAYARAPIPYGVWHYLEVKAFHDDTTGFLELRIDGAVIFSVSNVDLRNGTGLIGGIMFAGSRASCEWEDILIMDTTGTVMNDFVGDMRYELVPVDGDGTIVNWTPTSGDNYTTIDDPVGAPDDGDYIESSTTDQDNYAVHVPVTAPDHTAIYFAQLMVRTEADASGDEIALQVDSNGTVDRGPDQVLVNGGWRYRRQAWELDPDTGNPWTLSAINAAEWGVRKRV